jgi:hypothetical protein
VTGLELTDILTAHRLWMADPTTGQRADLRSADLCGADLCGADLRSADLRGADLCGADLCGANLRRANLRGADLRSADLRGANLRGADLRGADLRGARFSDASLSCSTGVLWAVAGPIGTDRRTVIGVWQDGRVTLHAGCFSGPRSEWDQIVANSVADPHSSPWEWPNDPTELARLAAECTAAADQIQASIHTQLAALGADQRAAADRLDKIAGADQ